MTWLTTPLLLACALGIRTSQGPERPSGQDAGGDTGARKSRKERDGVLRGFAAGYVRGLRAGRGVPDEAGPVPLPAPQRAFVADQPKQRGFKAFLKELKNEFDRDDVGTTAAALSYTTFLALFPFFIFLAAMSGFVTNLLNIDDPTRQILDALGSALPPSAADLIGTQVGDVIEASNGGLLSIGAVGSLWAASGAVRSLMKAMNRAYDVPESRPWYRKYPVSIGLTLLTSTFFIAAAVLMVVGQFWAMDILEAMGISGGWSAALIAWGRWPVIVALILLAMAFLYWVAPNINIPFRLITPGALTFTAGWLAATFGFIFYVSNFGSYNATYGTLGGVVVLLIWIYLSSLIMLIGAEINAMTSQRAEPGEMDHLRASKQAEAASKGLPHP